MTELRSGIFHRRFLAVLCLLNIISKSLVNGQAFLLQDLEELSDLLLSKEEWRPREVLLADQESSVKVSGAAEPMYYVPQKPRIVQPLKSEMVISGQPAIFVCMVEGNPSPRVHWTVSGRSVPSSPQFGEVVAMPRGSVLRISNTLPTLHGAPVVCLAENALGQAEATARLLVYQNEEAAPVGFPRFLNVFSVIVAKKSDNVELECRTQGEPAPVVRWFKDSVPVDLTNMRFLVTAAGSLKIARLIEEDEGKYECTATNSHGTRISPGESLMVRAERFRPHFTSVPASQQVVSPGGQITLTCTAVGVPAPAVAWFEGDIQLFRYMLDRQPPGTARLVITNLNASRNVSCVATSAMGQAIHEVAILVKELPPTPGDPRVLQYLREGEVSLVFARPPPKPPTSSGDQVSLAPEVVAFVVQWIESAAFLPDYADSLAPEVAAAIQPISEGGNPLAPHLTSMLTTAVNQAGLYFQLIDLSEIEPGANDIKFHLSGLRPYTNYTVWCRSIGANGDFSPPTKPLQFLTGQEAPSSPPLKIQASAISNAAVSVSWDRPLQPNGRITMYRVYYTEEPKAPLSDWSVKLVKVDSAATQSNSGGSTSTLTLLTHLKPNATYYIRVSASNIKGDGPVSPPYAVIVRRGALPPPVNFTAVSKSAHEVALHWDTPETQQREPPLINYELLVTPLDSEGKLEATSRQIAVEASLTSFLVNALLPNTKYEFRLAAVSETGAGIQAETTAKTKEYVPGPPNRVAVEATGSDQLKVTWTPPKESISPSLLAAMGQRANELRIAYYDIDIRATDAKGNWLSTPHYGSLDQQQQRPIRQQSTAERKIEEARGKLTYSREITGLLPSTHYVIHIRAVSRSGAGDRAKSNPVMTWPLPPKRPTALKLRSVISTKSRRRVLQAQWRPPVQEKIPVGGFRYRIQWRLLIPIQSPESLETMRRLKRHFESENLEPLSPQMAKELGIAEEFIGGEENVTKLSWESPSGRLVGGLAYEVRVATMDEYQTGDDVVGRIELPDEAPSLPPSGIRIDRSSPRLTLHWKAPPLEARNGRLTTYEAECSWVDVSQGFTDAWQAKSLKISPEGGATSTLFWPPGSIPLLNVSMDSALKPGMVFRSRVRAWTSAGSGPWSEFESLTVKELMPKEPSHINAVALGEARVLVTWAMPEGMLQTSFSRAKPDTPGPIYRYFVLEYAKQVDIAQPINWVASKTAGPQTALSLPIGEDADQYVVRVRSVGIADLHSEWSAPVLVRKIDSPCELTVDNLRCQPVTGEDSQAELELTWTPPTFPPTPRLLHYLVNYTGGRVYLNAEGHRIREVQSEREQSLRPTNSPFGLIAHRLVGLNYNFAYQVNVLPVFERSTTSCVVGTLGSVFCRTLSKPPLYVPKPEFYQQPATTPASGSGVILMKRVDEQNGTVATYEILAREVGPIDRPGTPAVLAQFFAVSLFRPLTKVVKVVLNGSMGGVDGENGAVYAPSLIPGQAYDIAVRACVEGQDAIGGGEGRSLRLDGMDTEALCSTSDWTGPGARNLNAGRTEKPTNQGSASGDELDDPLWPAVTRENISGVANSPQTPFNDAATGSRQADQGSPTDAVNFPPANMLNPPMAPGLLDSRSPSSSIDSASSSTYSDRIQIIVAALSIIIGICLLAFLCFLLFRRLQHNRRRRDNFTTVSAVSNGHGDKFNGLLKPTDIGTLKPAFGAGSMGTFSPGGGGGVTSPLLSMPRSLQTPDGLSVHSELMGTASLGRFSGVGAGMTLLEGGNCVCSTGGTPSLEMLSPSIGQRTLTLHSPPHPPPYLMNPSANMITGVINEHAGFQAVSIDNLAAHVEQLKANRGLLMSAEFESIDPGGQFTWEHSSRPANRPKNRYANVVTYDHSRVPLSRLDGDLDSDYINANFLDGYNRKCAYIATQGPLPNTVCDFWRMVWEQRSSTIVAMTRLEERERVKCEQYWPSSGISSNARMSPTKSSDWLATRSTLIATSDSSQTIGGGSTAAGATASPIATTTYGQITVSLMDVVELAYYTLRTFTVQKSGCREKREIRQLQFTAWPDHGVPNHPAPLLMFLRRVNAEFIPDAGPIVVHCSAGVGRTGAYIVLDILLQQMHHENVLDVLAVVTQLRSQRNFIVQTQEQYAFIYEALLEAALSGNTELSARQLKSHWHKLTVPCTDGEDGDNCTSLDSNSEPLANTGLALEFGQLVNQAAGPIAALVAHQSPGGVLACSEDFNPDMVSDVMAGALPVNLPKNRQGVDCIPYESNRVKLSPIRGVEGSDYINASYVDSYRLRNAFIATQTPMAAYLEDFWRMIWATSSSIIVQLDSFAFDKETPYWPSNEAARFGFLVAEPLSSYDMTAYVLREFRLTDAKSGQTRIIRLFEASHLTTLIGRAISSSRHMSQSSVNDVTLPPSLPPLAEWLPNRAAANSTPTFGFINGPGSTFYRSTSSDSYRKGVFDELTCQKAALSLIDLIEQVHKTQEQFGLDGPITVHCRTGTGYTGIFLMLSIMFERMRVEGVVDAFQTTKLLWWQRRGLVETTTEYAFCYATALEYLNLYEPLSSNAASSVVPAPSSNGVAMGQTPSSTLS